MQNCYIVVPRLPKGITIDAFISTIRAGIPQLLYFNTNNYPADPKITFTQYQQGGKVTECSIKKLREFGKVLNFTVFENDHVETPTERLTALTG